MTMPRVAGRRSVWLLALTLAISVATGTLAAHPGPAGSADAMAMTAQVLTQAVAPARALQPRSTLWVVATADGKVARSSGLAGLTRLGTGRYEARFTQKVHACAYTATVGDPYNGLVFNPGLVFTAGGHFSSEGVYVETKNLGGGLTDFPFHLSVICSPREHVVIDASGRLIRGTAVFHVRYGTGRYEAVFDRDTRNCAYSATIGDTGNQLVFSPGLVFTAGGHFSRNRGVYIETRNLAGTLTDLPFHLTLTCLEEPIPWERDGAVVAADGTLVKANAAQSVQKLGQGRYEVRFGASTNVRRCVYGATVADPGNNQVADPGLVFTGHGNQSGNGVYVETKNLGGGLTDLPFHLSVDCSRRSAASDGLSVLHLNLQGTDSTYGPWRDRHARVAAWMGFSQTVPDLLILQEVPASKCYIFHCDPKDYEALFSLMTEIEKETGIQYQVALMSTGRATEGGYPLYQGRAVLYNPVRLYNPATFSWDYQQYFTELSTTIERRESYPCRAPPDHWYWRCRLVDAVFNPPSTEPDPDPTWGLHWAVQGAAFVRLVLTESRRTVDVYDVHAPFIPNSGGTPDLGPIGEAVKRIEQVNPPPPTNPRLIPPIMAGDFNTSEYWMNLHTTEAGQPFEAFEVAAYAPESGRHPEDPDGREVIGMLVGEPGSFSSDYAARVASSRLLPEGGPGLCGEAAARWSDHCGQYVELLATPR